MTKTNKHKVKIQEYISKVVMKSNLSNDDLVQIIELCGSFLNIKSIPDYAKENNISYNGVKKCRNVVEIFGNKFVIDNE
ncbi:MAG: hypothetical protein QQN55_00995 [Nitrosopumilus sp.]